MDISQNHPRVRIPVVDFSPAELKKGSKGIWRIEFRVWNPNTNSMKRFQRRVKPMKNQRNRLRFAKRLECEINNKLERGWNPLIEMEAANSFALLLDVINQYLKNTEKKVKDGALRKDTLRSYKSFTSNLKKWISLNYKNDVFCLEFNKNLVGRFLDYIYYERDNSPRTHNNYLSFINTLSQFMLQKDYIKANPTNAFKKIPTTKKKRELIPKKDRVKIFKYLDENNKGMLVVTQMMFYQLIRRTEMSKLKVSDINLKEKYIRIRSTVNKNKKEQYVCLLEPFIPFLVQHLAKAKTTDFVFSKNNLLPGKNPIAPKKLSDEWIKIKKALNLKNEYQFYSIKDSGISELLRSGIPAIKVRDHARHSEISMTEKYTPRNNAEDLNKFTKKFKF